MARVPAEDRLGFGKRRHMGGIDLALHRDGAQIDECQIVARFQGFDRGRIDADAEAGRVVQQPEKHGLARGAERARFVRRKQRVGRRAFRHEHLRLEHNQFAADNIDAGAPMFVKRRELGLVAAQRGGALKQAAGIGLTQQ